MKRRDVPIDVPNRWPFLTVGVADAAWVAKVPALPGSRLRVVRDYSAAVSHAQSRFKSDEALDDAGAVVLDEIAAAHGWVLLTTWADPALELEARTLWDAGGFAGIDAKDKAGLAAIGEIADHFGLSWQHIIAVVAEVLRIVTPGGDPTGAEVAEARIFSSPRSDSLT